MARGTLAEAAEAMEARILNGDPQTVWTGAALDSRRVSGGELFFALRGERTDGHRFVDDALGRGAAAAVVERAPELGHTPEAAVGAVLDVPDVYNALHELTRAVRRRVPERLVAITGSAGKTTTKELLSAMLAQRFRVASNPGNLNNLYGFPLSLLGIPDETEWMVAEMGMSTPGELGRISRLGRPDVAVFTNVRSVHLEFFGNLNAIGDAKAELLEGLDPDGLVVANAADAEITRIARKHQGPTVWYGLDASSEPVAESSLEPALEHWAAEIVSTTTGGSRFVWSWAKENGTIERRTIELCLFGRHNVENFLAAAACATALGVSPDQVAAAASSVVPAPMRGVVHRLSEGRLVVDDSYNSNPDAVEKALVGAAALGSGRRWAVLGSMLELGPESPRFHREAGAAAARLGFSPVWAVGEEARELARGASDAGAEARSFSTAAEAARDVSRESQAGDVVLIKGSRGVELEIVVAALLGSED